MASSGASSLLRFSISFSCTETETGLTLSAVSFFVSVSLVGAVVSGVETAFSSFGIEEVFVKPQVSHVYFLSPTEDTLGCFVITPLSK